MLGAIAQQYGQHIYFGFNALDTDCPDTDQIFIALMNRIFSHLNITAVNDMQWENCNFSFNAPFGSYTQSQMVKKCLSQGMPIDWIRNIRTCYNGKSKNGCGVCRCCTRKATALLSNGISIGGLFDREITKETLEEKFRIVTSGEDDYPPTYADEIRKAITFLRQEKK